MTYTLVQNWSGRTKNDMCICLINGMFLEKGRIEKSFENTGTIFMMYMYRAKSPNSQFGGTDHLDTKVGTEQLRKELMLCFLNNGQRN